VSIVVGVTNSSQTSPFIQEADPISKHASLGKYKSMVMGLDGTRKEDCTGEAQQQFTQ
jgi:hypothetical protein